MSEFSEFFEAFQCQWLEQPHFLGPALQGIHAVDDRHPDSVVITTETLYT